MIYDLRFACHYSVKVQTVSPEGVTGPAKLISFPTPICQEIPVRGITKPDCPTNGKNLDTIKASVFALLERK